MSRMTWTRLRKNAAEKLTRACALLSQRPAKQAALATIVALAEIKLTTHLQDGRLDPKLIVSPIPEGDCLAQELLELIAQHAADHASHARPDSSPPFGDWVEEHGLSEMSIALLGSDADWQQLTAVAEIVAGAIRTLSARSKQIALAHMQDVLERDLPSALSLKHGLSSAACWLLAPETGGQPHRAEVLTRRSQAMTLYGALSGTLYDADITRAIDQGMPLAPLLMQRHDLGRAELCALRQARRLRHSIETPTDFHVAVQELKAHDVPLHEWPGHGRPGQADAWETSVWIKGSRQNIVRPDYLGLNTNSVQDAMNALRDDLLRPLVTARIRLGDFKPTRQVQSFAHTVVLDGARGGGEPRRQFLAALRHAIVGHRKPKAFNEAVDLWHRRVASLSALRHERMVERPGWPALCAPWRSPCGRYEIVVLSSATDLVEEGRTLDHCVGGYYEICRRGDTQILSLREDGNRIATVELKLGSDLAALMLEVGQFKAYRNSAPLVHFHDPLRAFLRAVRNGDHPINAGKLARYRRKMRETWDGPWNSQALSLAHARDVFPFYLPLLPRGTPADFDAWCMASGLTAALDATLAHLEASPR